MTYTTYSQIKEKLAERIREVAAHLYMNADRIADQPDWLTDMRITIDLSADRTPGYSIDTDHIVDTVYNLEEVAK